MTVTRDFFKSLNNSWLKKNIQGKFGKDLASPKTFIARVLEVEDIDERESGGENLKDASPAAWIKYRIRCRILMPPPYAIPNLSAEGPPNPAWAIENPDVYYPDPCDWTKPTARIAIERHPWYNPRSEKEKKPYVGDLVMVSRTVSENPGGEVGEYIGFLVQTPPLLPPPEAKKKGGFGGKRYRGEKEKITRFPPTQYNKDKLAAIAEKAAFAINNAEAWVQDQTRNPNQTPHEARKGILDFRLSQIKFVNPIGGGYRGIPESWFTKGSGQFEALSDFILDVSDGYPGMPNGHVRKDFASQTPSQADAKTVIAPAMKVFATTEEFWKTWWWGKRQRTDQAWLNPDYRRYIMRNKWMYGGRVRFGFGSFVIEDAFIPKSPPGGKYFPKKKEISHGIRYSGANGIGDAVCEMYAVMMFIKLNFGSPIQFSGMQGESNKMQHNQNDLNKCEWSVKYGGNGIKEFGTYKMNNTIMPQNSQYRNGLCTPHPPSRDK